MRSLHRFWMVGLTSPLIYLVICLVVNQQVFAKRTVAGFCPLPAKLYDWLFIALTLVGLTSLPVVYLLKCKWAAKAPGGFDEESSLLETRRGRRFLVTFMICDSIALMGLILFLVQGRIAAMLLFGILGLLNYAIAHPGQP